MPTYDSPSHGDDRKTARRGGFFPLTPGLLHDARMSGLTWRQRYLFITLLANAWRGADRNGRLVPGQVIRPLPDLAADLGIRVDHVRADLTRLTARGLVTLDGGSVLVADFEGWHGQSAASAERTVGSRQRDPVSQNGEFGSQNGNPAPQNGVIDSQNGATDSRNGVEDSQNGVTEVPSAQQAQGFVPSVRRCSDVRSENLSEESSSDVPAAAFAAPVTSTAGDDDLTCRSDSNYDGNDNDNGESESNDLRTSSPSAVVSGPERSEGPRRGDHSASPAPTDAPADEQQVEDLLRRAGLTASLARKYRSVVTPREASDMITIFTDYYTDKGLREKIVPCLVAALREGREHVLDVIRNSRTRFGHRRIEPGTGTTSGEPRRSETAEDLRQVREDNRRRRQLLGELANRL
ncbi:MAG: hypothetical protein ABFE08_16325 [Armatimonadia bacterium]